MFLWTLWSFAVIFLLLGPRAEGASESPSAPPAAKQSPTQESEKNSPPTSAGTTADLSTLSLARNLLFVQLEKGFFQIREVFLFQNAGQKTIVSRGGAPTIQLLLPRSSNIRDPSAQLISVPEGLKRESLRLEGNQILSTEPIPPGMKMVVLTYRLADEFGGITVEKPAIYGARSFAILPEKDRVQVGGEGLSRGAEVTFQNIVYAPLVGATRRGSMVRFSLKAPDSLGGIVYFYAVGGGLVVLGAVLALAIRVRRKKGLARQVEREELLRSLAVLDDRLAQGQISSEEHGRQRSPQFARLRELSR